MFARFSNIWTKIWAASGSRCWFAPRDVSYARHERWGQHEDLNVVTWCRRSACGWGMPGRFITEGE